MKHITKIMLATLIAAPLAAPCALPQLVQAQGLQLTTSALTAITPQAQGHISIKGGTATYPTLEAALTAAKDNDVLEVYGKVVLNNNVEIDKSVTLKAGATGATLSASNEQRTGTPSKSPYAVALQVKSGKTLTLGTGDNSSELLLDEVHVLVTNGSFVFKEGAHISSKLCSANSKHSAIVEISGETTKASFEGGKIDNPVADYGTANNGTAVAVYNGATVEKISGGSYMSWCSAWSVSGEKTKIKEISGGTFSNSKDSGISSPCFLIEKHASVDKISGGTFRSYRFGALQVESGGHIGEIAGGEFKNLYDMTKPIGSGSGAKPFFSGLVLYNRNGKDGDTITVDKISGGTFIGVNGMLSVGNTPKQKVHIGSITGGTFQSIGTKDGNTGMYCTQNTEVDEITSAVKATGKNVGLWNAGTIHNISGGTFTGKNNDGLQNVDLSETTHSWAKNFKGHIDNISGGTFTGKEQGIKNAGVVDTISGGMFVGDTHAILCSGKTKKGQLSTISGGAFYAKNGNTITLVSKLSLEPNLGKKNEECGVGRYYAPSTMPIFNKTAEVTYPAYTDEHAAKQSYAMSTAEAGKKDVAAYPNTAFRYLKGPKVSADKSKDKQDDPNVHVLYRLYNLYTHEHFFTAETVENDNLVRLGWKSEGGVGYIYKHGEKGGVYRLYNPTTGEHHYTMKEDEVAQCVKAGWKNEGVKWFSAQNKEVTLNKLYSMYNPYEKKFYHHYTADAKEIEQMVEAGWRKEEVKWCTLPLTYIIKK